jgi:hypothetical protein
MSTDCKYKRTRQIKFVQESKVPSYTSLYQNEVISAEVLQLFWPGNSPDLKVIEPCWIFIKQQTTRKGAPT